MFGSKRRRVVLASVVVLLLLGGYGALRAWDGFIGNAPVRSYGRVVDETGAPLGGVRVAGKIGRVRRASHPLFPRVTREPFTVVTDERGRFDVRASRAKYLSFASFDKLGWELKDRGAGMSTGFEYPLMGYEYPPGARKRPDDPDDPIVYTMVRANK
jgi:hypothetical protein